MPVDDVKDSPLLVAALRYAEMGFPVFPCRPNGKLPATGHGHNDATTYAEQVHQWWQRQQNRNIGLSCAGLLVVDVDPAGLAWPGDDDKRQVIKATGCPLQQTPRGGYHLGFGIPDGHRWREARLLRRLAFPRGRRIPRGFEQSFF